MKMSFSKTKNIIAILGVASTIFASCKKYLDPQPVSVFSPQVIFQNTQYARTAVMGAYNALTGDYGYGIRISMYYPYDSDEMMGQGQATQDNERRDIARYNLTSNNTQLAPVFNQLYSGIAFSKSRSIA